MEQNTPEWHNWRSQGLGSSDAPIIMGLSPYQSPFGLWEEKLGRREPFAGNFATERGQRLEPAARAAYELINDRPMPPLLVQHQNYPFLRASLDGADVEQKLILEIKCCGKQTFFNARDERLIPEHHLVQMYHQLLVSGFERAHYFVFWQGKGSLVEVLPDLHYMEKLLHELIKFWEMVEKKIPPELTELDHKRERSLERRRRRAETCQSVFHISE